MLEKPELEDEKLRACLRDKFGLKVRELAFLPLGNDPNTAVYRAVGEDGTAYFVKLRSGVFDTLSVEVPKLLQEQGVRQVIAPLTTRSGELWAGLERFHVMVFPFVEGRNGWEVALTEAQWVEFGQALKALHSAALPSEIIERLRKETYSPEWREKVRGFQKQAETTTFSETVAAELAVFLKAQREIIRDLVNRAERLALELQTRTLPSVMCHADIHVGNLLLEADGTLHMVDWDTLVYAPKERDLMFPGGGLGGGWYKPEDELSLFYEGYGEVEIDRDVLAYYRYERIVEDIAVYCHALLTTEEGGADRSEGLRQLKGQFKSGEVIDLAYRTEGVKYEPKI